MKFYILDDNNEPQPVDLHTWMMTFGDIKRRAVKQTMVAGSEVSTVFLGLDHNYSGHGPPILFETQIFGDVWGGEMWRYATYVDALRHHEEIVAQLRDHTENLMEGQNAATIALGGDGIEFE